MNQPVTELDQRFSDPGAEAAGWDETRRVLEEGPAVRPAKVLAFAKRRFGRTRHSFA